MSRPAPRPLEERLGSGGWLRGCGGAGGTPRNNALVPEDGKQNDVDVECRRQHVSRARDKKLQPGIEGLGEGAVVVVQLRVLIHVHLGHV